jgi:hypothetical protein
VRVLFSARLLVPLIALGAWGGVTIAFALHHGRLEHAIAALAVTLLGLTAGLAARAAALRFALRYPRLHALGVKGKVGTQRSREGGAARGTPPAQVEVDAPVLAELLARAEATAREFAIASRRFPGYFEGADAELGRAAARALLHPEDRAHLAAQLDRLRSALAQLTRCPSAPPVALHDLHELHDRAEALSSAMQELRS